MAQNDSPIQIPESNAEVKTDVKENVSLNENENNISNDSKKMQSPSNEIVISIDLEKNTIKKGNLDKNKNQINLESQIDHNSSNKKNNIIEKDFDREQFQEPLNGNSANIEIKKQIQNDLNKNQNTQKLENEINDNGSKAVKLGSNDDEFDEFQDFEDIKPEPIQKKVEPEIKKTNDLSKSIFSLNEEEFIQEIKKKMNETLNTFCKNNQSNSKNDVDSPEVSVETNILNDHSVNLFKCCEKPIIEIKSENILTLQQFREIVENSSKQKQILTSLQLNHHQNKNESDFSPSYPKLEINPLIEQYTNLQKLINNMSKNFLILSPKNVLKEHNENEEKNQNNYEKTPKDPFHVKENKNDISIELKDLNLEKDGFVNKVSKTENIPRPSTLEKTFEKMGYKFVEGGKKEVSKVEVVVEKLENDELNEIINKFPNLLFLLENTLLIQNDIFDEAIKINY